MMDLPPEKLRVLELFSGIGGIHFAFHDASLPHKIVAAIDINTVANEVYRHNFPDCNLLQRNVQFLNAKVLEKFAPDVITMSPPCQPFTRIGLKQDCDDARTEPLLHIISLLKELQNKPSIFLENVKGFESSEACRRTLDVLRSCDYNLQQFLLSPKQLGVPNSRLRYYLLAKPNLPGSSFQTVSQIQESLPTCVSNSTIPNKLQDYFEDLESFEEYMVPDAVLLKHRMILDIVSGETTNSCCFTKGYKQYVEGTGSVIQSIQDEQMDSIYKEVCLSPKDDDKCIALLRRLGLRYFTPREVANLMCFPPKFSFPDTVTERQQYRVLGNSVNVQVVASLLKILICENKEISLL